MNIFKLFQTSNDLTVPTIQELSGIGKINEKLIDIETEKAIVKYKQKAKNILYKEMREQAHMFTPCKLFTIKTSYDAISNVKEEIIRELTSMGYHTEDHTSKEYPQYDNMLTICTKKPDKCI